MPGEQLRSFVVVSLQKVPYLTFSLPFKIFNFRPFLKASFLARLDPGRIVFTKFGHQPYDCMYVSAAMQLLTAREDKLDVLNPYIDVQRLGPTRLAECELKMHHEPTAHSTHYFSMVPENSFLFVQIAS